MACAASVSYTHLDVYKRQAYHRVMECLEYNKTDSTQQLKEQIDALVQSKKMSEAEVECIRISDIQSFVNGALGQRMKMCIRDRLYGDGPVWLRKFR